MEDKPVLERLSCEHYGPTSNIYHSPVITPCHNCRNQGIMMQAHWIGWVGQPGKLGKDVIWLCDKHAKGYPKQEQE